MVYYTVYEAENGYVIRAASKTTIFLTLSDLLISIYNESKKIDFPPYEAKRLVEYFQPLSEKHITI